MLEGFVAIKEGTAVRERIGCDVEDAHDERALSEFQGSRTYAPVKDRPHELDSKRVETSGVLRLLRACALRGSRRDQSQWEVYVCPQATL